MEVVEGKARTAMRKEKTGETQSHNQITHSQYNPNKQNKQTNTAKRRGAKRRGAKRDGFKGYKMFRTMVLTATNNACGRIIKALDPTRGDDIDCDHHLQSWDRRE